MDEVDSRLRRLQIIHWSLDRSRPASFTVQRITVHLVFLTAFQSEPFGPALDRKHEAALLKGAILLALQGAGISADVGVGFGAVEVAAGIAVRDADAAFAALAPVLLASPFCKNGYVLIRYGAPGAPERQVSLADLAYSASLTV